MSDEDLERARKAGEAAGKLLQQVEMLVKRVARLENGALAVLAGAAALWAKSKGLW